MPSDTHARFCNDHRPEAWVGCASADGYKIGYRLGQAEAGTDPASYAVEEVERALGSATFVLMNRQNKDDPAWERMAAAALGDLDAAAGRLDEARSGEPVGTKGGTQ